MYIYEKYHIIVRIKYKNYILYQKMLLTHLYDIFHELNSFASISMLVLDHYLRVPTWIRINNIIEENNYIFNILEDSDSDFKILAPANVKKISNPRISYQLLFEGNLLTKSKITKRSKVCESRISNIGEKFSFRTQRIGKEITNLKQIFQSDSLLPKLGKYSFNDKFNFDLMLENLLFDKYDICEKNDYALFNLYLKNGLLNQEFFNSNILLPDSLEIDYDLLWMFLLKYPKKNITYYKKTKTYKNKKLFFRKKNNINYKLKAYFLDTAKIHSPIFTNEQLLLRYTYAKPADDF